MGTQDDSNQTFALGVLAGVVALVLAGVVALAASVSARQRAPVVAEASARAAMLGPSERLYFEPGSDALPADAPEVLLRVADVVRGNLGTSVLISGFHDASGDARQNAELALRRAQAVRHALEADGVEPHSLMLARPEQTNGGADAREARRVEIRVR